MRHDILEPKVTGRSISESTYTYHKGTTQVDANLSEILQHYMTNKESYAHTFVNIITPDALHRIWETSTGAGTGHLEIYEAASTLSKVDPLERRLHRSSVMSADDPVYAGIYNATDLTPDIIKYELDKLVHIAALDRRKAKDILKSVVVKLGSKAKGLFLLRMKDDPLELVISSYVGNNNYTNVLLTSINPTDPTDPIYKDHIGASHGRLQDILNEKMEAKNMIILPT